MPSFVSTRNLFCLELPEGWSTDIEENIYTFQFSERSALQISPAFHPGGKQFHADEESKKEQQKHPTAQIVVVSTYPAIHYALRLGNPGMLQYVWIIGHKNVKLFVTLTIKSDCDEQALDHLYRTVLDILDTLKITPVELEG